MWFDDYGNLIKDIPSECVADCIHSGQCQDDVHNWVIELDFDCPREKAIEYLTGFGAWDDLESVDQETLNERVLWIACGDIDENGEWFGLNH